MRENNFTIIKILQKRKYCPDNVTSKSIFEEECPTQIAINLRKMHYGQDIIGAKKSHPLHQRHIVDVEQLTGKELNKSVLIQLSDEYANTINPMYLKSGSFSVYYGSATKEEVNKPNMEHYLTRDFIKSFQQLVMLKSWTVRLNAVGVVSLIDDLIKEGQIKIEGLYDDSDISDWYATNQGGNMIHRYRSVLEKRSAMLNHQPTVGTHIKQSTNRLKTISKCGDEFKLHFQMLLISNRTRIIKLKRYDSPGIPQFASMLCL